MARPATNNALWALSLLFNSAGTSVGKYGANSLPLLTGIMAKDRATPLAANAATAVGRLAANATDGMDPG